MNRTIPDLGVPGNLPRWARLEAAKRRMLYDLDMVGLTENWLRQQPRLLQFDFMTDAVKTNGRWLRLDDGDPIYTGHANGLITVNLKEADPVERERSRVEFGEAQRTLIGHFRHEVGHYVWDMLVRDQPHNLDTFRAHFGDPYAPIYSEALDRYYQDGPAANWGDQHVSAYASMHPWEDWAETWNTYLSMMSTLELAAHHEVFREPADDSINEAMDEYARFSIALNEINRNRGLTVSFPEILTNPVRTKIAAIHQMVKMSPSTADTHPLS